MQGRVDVLSGVEIPAEARQELPFEDSTTEEMTGAGAASVWLGLIVLAGRVLRGFSLVVRQALLHILKS